MSLASELNKALRIKEIKRSKHLFPLKDSTFRNKDLIEGIKVIFSKDVTMSKVTKKFEKTFSKKIKTPYSLMVNSGSSANLLAFQCLINPYRKKRLKKGDEVLVPSICWPTSFWPIIQSGLKPVFVDVDREVFLSLGASGLLLVDWCGLLDSFFRSFSWCHLCYLFLQ